MLSCSSQRNANTLACPICRKTTCVTGGKVANLKTNVLVKSLVDDIRNSKQLCEMCDAQSRAVRFCCDCSKNVCNACLQKHNNWSPNLKHRVVSVEDIREGKVVLKKKVYCQEEVHESDDEKYACTDVCATCKKFICMRCIFYHDKKGHTVQDAGEYNISFKKDSESLQARGKTKTTTVKNHMTCVDNQLKRVTDHIDGEKARINKTCEEAINKIKERNAILNKQLDTEKEKLCQSLKKMKVADERLVTSIESASELASNSLKAPLEGDVVAIRDSLSGDLKNVLDQDDPQKKLANDVADRAEELTFTPISHQDQLSMGKLRFIKCESKCNVALPQKYNMNAMAATKNSRMAVGYSAGGIDIFSADGQLQKTVLKDISILKLGFLSDGRRVVRNTSNDISLYTSEYEKLDVTFNTLDKSEGGRGGLTVDSNDLIYLGYRIARKIQVFSSAGGKAIREIPCDGYEPIQITSYGDSLIVKHYDNVIIRIDRKGNTMHKVVSSSGHNLSASVTKGNSIMIASFRHAEGLLNIDEYTNDLKHVKTLIVDHKIQKPERDWYYLKEFQSGELGFCTPDRLYIFKLSTTPVNP
ncbi:uncharacterized protein LOC105447376 [Strongylocentrotus purpuratus]|uniref:B box-type domain-containing protein n=1 Tax=Strongylocentrotus purpuratus TaxID=7668 RepID=A0A7M7HQK1_STRPU|nr:uncharacterized protein LOC105447376 [Strongylocentrotus purpuratus]